MTAMRPTRVRSGSVRLPLSLLVGAVATLSACDLPPPDPEKVAQECEDRARAAQGPTGEITVGTNSRTGGFFEGSIGVSSDFLRGADPLAVHESCVMRRTGQPPIRPPALR